MCIDIPPFRFPDPAKPAPAPTTGRVTLRAGAYYRTVSGEVRGPVTTNPDHPDYPFRTEETSYGANGKYWGNAASTNPHGADLVEEVNADGSALTTKVAKLFRIGDKVRCPRKPADADGRGSPGWVSAMSTLIGVVGTVREIFESTGRVRVEFGDGETWAYNTAWLESASPAPTLSFVVGNIYRTKNGSIVRREETGRFRVVAGGHGVGSKRGSVSGEDYHTDAAGVYVGGDERAHGMDVVEQIWAPSVPAPAAKPEIIMSYGAVYRARGGELVHVYDNESAEDGDRDWQCRRLSDKAEYRVHRTGEAHEDKSTCPDDLVELISDTE